MKYVRLIGRKNRESMSKTSLLDRGSQKGRAGLGSGVVINHQNDHGRRGISIPEIENVVCQCREGHGYERYPPSSALGRRLLVDLHVAFRDGPNRPTNSFQADRFSASS